MCDFIIIQFVILDYKLIHKKQKKLKINCKPNQTELIRFGLDWFLCINTENFGITWNLPKNRSELNRLHPDYLLLWPNLIFGIKGPFFLGKLGQCAIHGSNLVVFA